LEYERRVRLTALPMLLALALASLPVAPLRAQAPDPNAKRLYIAGLQAYEAGRYEVAIKAFEAAYALAPADLLVFDLAQAYRKKFIAAGERAALERAVELYRKFLASPATGHERAMAGDALGELLVIEARQHDEGAAKAAPAAPAARTEIMVVTEAAGARVALDGKEPSPAPLLETVTPGEHRARVSAPGYDPLEVRVMAVAGRFVVSEARLRARPGELVVPAPAGAQLEIDGRAAGTLPLDSLEVAAGSHRVNVHRRGFHSWEREVQVGRDARLELRPTLAPTSARRAVRWTAIAAAVAGAATIAAGAVWGVADSDAQAIHARQEEVGISLAEKQAYDRYRTRRDEARVATVVTLALGAALTVSTVGLYVLDRR
jgi:hypothetical protein